MYFQITSEASSPVLEVCMKKLNKMVGRGFKFGIYGVTEFYTNKAYTMHFFHIWVFHSTSHL